MKRVEISTTRQVEPKLWDQAGQFVKGNTAEAKAINQQLTIMKAHIHGHFLQLQALDKAVTAEAVRNAYLGITRTLIEAFDFHNRRFAEKVAVGKRPASHQRLAIGRAKAGQKEAK